MKKIILLAETGSDVNAALAKEYGVEIVPMHVSFDTETLDDGDFPVEKISPVNTTACGDSFSAGYLYEFLETGDFETALAKGTWCAARNAENIRCGSIEG